MSPDKYWDTKPHKPLGSNRTVCVLYIKLLLVYLSTFLKSTTVRIKEHICCMFLYELTSWIHFFLETLECFFLGKVLLQLTVTFFHSTKTRISPQHSSSLWVLPHGIVFYWKQTIQYKCKVISLNINDTFLFKMTERLIREFQSKKLDPTFK